MVSSSKKKYAWELSGSTVLSESFEFKEEKERSSIRHFPISGLLPDLLADIGGSGGLLSPLESNKKMMFLVWSIPFA